MDRRCSGWGGVRRTRIVGCVVVLAVVGVLGGPARGESEGESSAGFEALAARYREIAPLMRANPLELPIHVEGQRARGWVRGDVYSVVDQPFGAVQAALGSVERWCDVLILHLNAKACTYRAGALQQGLTLYLGRKFYQPPEQAHRLELDFAVTQRGRDHLALALHADRGPLGTREHELHFEAIPLPAGRTLIRFSYAHARGLLSRLAMFSYLRTLGRKKVGFSVVGRDVDGRPQYVEGVQAVIERNAMRYQLAIQAYLETAQISGEAGFERRAERWFELTSAFPSQLFEFDRETYLEHKRREWANQSGMQADIQLVAGRRLGGSGSAVAR